MRLVFAASRKHLVPLVFVAWVMLAGPGALTLRLLLQRNAAGWAIALFLLGALPLLTYTLVGTVMLFEKKP